MSLLNALPLFEVEDKTPDGESATVLVCHYENPEGKPLCGKVVKQTYSSFDEVDQVANKGRGWFDYDEDCENCKQAFKEGKPYKLSGDALIIHNLKEELAHTIGKLAWTRGELYSYQFALENKTLEDTDTDLEYLKKGLTLTSGGNHDNVLTHEEVEAGFKWFNDLLHEE